MSHGHMYRATYILFIADENSYILNMVGNICLGSSCLCCFLLSLHACKFLLHSLSSVTTGILSRERFDQSRTTHEHLFSMRMSANRICPQHPHSLLSSGATGITCSIRCIAAGPQYCTGVMAPDGVKYLHGRTDNEMALRNCLYWPLRLLFMMRFGRHAQIGRAAL